MPGAASDPCSSHQSVIVPLVLSRTVPDLLPLIESRAVLPGSHRVSKCQVPAGVYVDLDRGPLHPCPSLPLADRASGDRSAPWGR
jgi:hypothetical protein